MKIKTNIANFITLCNLLCGVFAIYYLFQERYILTVLLGLLAAVFDFADGFVARLLKVKSEMGKQLDSLSDVVSFGVAPGFAVFSLFQISASEGVSDFPYYVAFLGFFIPVFSAWRLAKFNIDEKQVSSFLGLPTPANAILIFSILALVSGIKPENVVGDFLCNLFLQPEFLLMLVIISCFLLVSNIPLFSFKFTSFDWSRNKMRYILLVVSLVLILLLQFAAVPFIIILYIIFSVIDKYILNKLS